MIKNYKKYFDEINSALNNIDLNHSPKELYDPIKYILKIKSKRVRPILSILAFKLNKKNWVNYINPILSIELFHNFTLIHDDIMDNANIRRGKKTIHKKWNYNIGILSGDLLMIIANKMLSELPIDILPIALQRFNDTAIKVCEGQQYDMNYENKNSITEKKYLEMIRLKTGALIGFSLELGGIISKMNDKDSKKLYQFGEYMGMGFQLKDDYLDVFGDQKFGKKIGGDIILNKKTFLIIKLLKIANKKEKIIINKWMKNSINPKQKVKEISDMMINKNIDVITESIIEDYFNKAYKCLDHINIENKDELIGFTKNLIKRKT